MTDTKPEKATDDRLSQIFAWMERRGGPGFADEIRNHIAALEAEHDRVMRQGQADHRALHDALGWAHGWHGDRLPPPSRAVLGIISERDVHKRNFDAELAGAGSIRKRYGARDSETFESFIARLHQDAQTLAGVRLRAADEKRMVTVQPSHAAGLVTRAIDRILGAREGEGAQSPGKGAAYTIPALPADEQADALVAEWCAEQEQGAASAPSATDPFHPNGRCTCAGEGACAWCERVATEEAPAAPPPRGKAPIDEHSLTSAETRTAWLELAAHATIRATEDVQDMSASLGAARLAALAALGAPRPASPGEVGTSCSVSGAFAKVLVTLEACRIFINGPAGVRTIELRDAEIPAAIADLALLERRMGTLAQVLQSVEHVDSRNPNEGMRYCPVCGECEAGHTDDCLLHAALTDAPPVFTLEEVERAISAATVPSHLEVSAELKRGIRENLAALLASRCR